MGNEDSPEYSITIEYDGFLTRFDLDEILKSIDRIIEDEFLEDYYPELGFYRRRRGGFGLWSLARESHEPHFSYVGIKAINSGSIELIVVAGGFVLGYIAKRFKKGVDESLLAEQLQRTGHLAGDVLGSVLARVNDWAERYVPKQRELGGRVTKITAKRKGKGVEDKRE
jgi:hypothetical protein